MTVVKNIQPQIYISYSWTEEKKYPLIDELRRLFTASGLEFRYDQREVKHGDIVTNFLLELGRAEHIILVLSPSYFKSQYCMFELLQIWKNGNPLERISLIKLDNLPRLDDLNYQSEITRYWKNKLATTSQENLDSNFTSKVIFKHIAIYNDIYQNLSEILDDISSTVTWSLQDLRKNDFQPILEKVLFNAKNKKSIFQQETNILRNEIRAQRTKLNHFDEKIQQLKATYKTRYTDIIKWLSKDKKILVDIIFKEMENELGSLITRDNLPATLVDIDEFKLHVIFYLEQFEVCLLDNNTSILDEPIFSPKIQTRFFDKFFELIIKRIPPNVSKKSKERLSKYMQYLLSIIGQ